MVTNWMGDMMSRRLFQAVAQYCIILFLQRQIVGVQRFPPACFPRLDLWHGQIPCATVRAVLHLLVFLVRMVPVVYLQLVMFSVHVGSTRESSRVRLVRLREIDVIVLVRELGHFGTLLVLRVVGAVFARQSVGLVVAFLSLARVVFVVVFIVGGARVGGSLLAGGHERRGVW